MTTVIAAANSSHLSCCRSIPRPAFRFDTALPLLIMLQHDRETIPLTGRCTCT
jgi:hypothetical protein